LYLSFCDRSVLSTLDSRNSCKVLKVCEEEMCGWFYDYVKQKHQITSISKASVTGKHWTSRTHVEWPDSGYYFKLQNFVASKTLFIQLSLR